MENKALFFPYENLYGKFTCQPQRASLWQVATITTLFQLVKAVLSLRIFLVTKSRLFDNKEFHVVRASQRGLKP